MIGLELVHIKWIDSEVSNEWSVIGELSHSFDEIHSVGFLIDQTEQGYVLAGMWDVETCSINAIQFIPKGCVTKVTSLCLLKKMMK